jgi:hypothetical protein
MPPDRTPPRAPVWIPVETAADGRSLLGYLAPHGLFGTLATVGGDGCRVLLEADRGHTGDLLGELREIVTRWQQETGARAFLVVYEGDAASPWSPARDVAARPATPRRTDARVPVGRRRTGSRLRLVSSAGTSPPGPVREVAGTEGRTSGSGSVRGGHGASPTFWHDSA